MGSTGGSIQPRDGQPTAASVRPAKTSTDRVGVRIRANTWPDEAKEETTDREAAQRFPQ